MRVILLLAAFHLYGPRMDYGGAYAHPYLRVHAPDCEITEHFDKQGRTILVLHQNELCKVSIIKLGTSGAVVELRKESLYDPPELEEQ